MRVNRFGRSRQSVIYRAVVPGAAVALSLAAPRVTRADYLYSGPNGGGWSNTANWVYVHDDPMNPGTLLHDPMTFYPGDTGTDLAVTTNINNGVNNSSVDFSLGAATASIGRLYIGSNNSGPGSTDTFYGSLSIQPQQLTINSGTLIVSPTQFAIIGRHVNGKLVQNGGTFDAGGVIRFNDTVVGTSATYEYHQGDLKAGLGNTGSNPGIRLGNASGSSGTMIIYNDGPGHIWVKSYYSATARAGSGGFANIGLTEFHYKSGNVRTVRVGDGGAGANQVSLRNDDNNPTGNYSTQLNFVMDQAATVNADGVPNSVALFTTPSVTSGGAGYAVFYKSGGTGRYLDRGSTYDGTGGRAFDAATDSLVVTSSFGGTTYAWDITYSGKATWDGGFDNITSIAGHGAGTDIVMIGRSVYSGAQWTAAADGNWSSGPWSTAAPNGVGAGANFFLANTTSGNVTVNVDGNYTVGSIQFDNVNKYAPAGFLTTNYSLSGTGSITVQAPGVSQGFVRAIEASHTIDANLNLASDTRFSVSSGATLKVNHLQPTAKAVIKGDGGTLAVNNVRAPSLTIEAGTVRAKPDGSASGLSIIDTLTVNPGATLDNTDNDLVINSMTFAQVKGMVQTGKISSSTAAGNQVLALFDNALVHRTDWLGQPIGASAIVGKFTFLGDVNMDGQVTGDDYTIIDSNLNTTPNPGLAWRSGDANSDGNITGDDYTVIDANLGQGAGNPLSPSALSVVPEPGAGVLLFVPFAAALLRRARPIQR